MAVPVFRVRVDLLCSDLRSTVLSDLCCVSCEAPLDIHQPNADCPSKLLATCLECNAWHLVNISENEDFSVLITRLPEVAEIRRSVRLDDPQAKPNPK